MQPKGFWSYARGDDDHLDGALTELRKAVAGEVSMLLGLEVGIFQDIHDLRTGDDWATKLRASVSSASFLIPVLTPRFFNRPWCREEVLTYLRLSKDVGVEPRIFPIRFVEWDDQDGCEVRAALAPFQYKDMSNWRFESDPTKRLQLLNEFSKDVKAKLNLPPAPRQAVRVAPEPARSDVTQASTSKAPEGPKYKTHVVDPFPGRGDFITIGAAIAAAEPGAKIVVREGTYREALRLSKPLEITGEGDRERILVVTAMGHALHCDAPMARISGMRFRSEPKDHDVWVTDFGLWITDGAVEIDDCVVESLSSTCVEIRGPGSSPSLRRCVLRQGVGGLLVHDGAQPVVEDCEMLGSTFGGVEVKGAATRATLRRCVARDGKRGGYYFRNGAGGILDSCDAVGNAYSGIHISTGADPILRECTFRDNKQSGVLIYEAGRGRLQGCTITGNGGSGVFVQKGGAPEVTSCTISRNAYEAVWIRDAASSGVFRGNDLSANARGA